METKYIELLIDELRHSQDNLKPVKNGDDVITIPDFPLRGLSLKFIKENRINISTENFLIIEKEYLVTFLRPRLNKIPHCKFYFNQDINLYLYKNFTNDDIGQFKKALWVAGILKKIANIFEELNRKLS